MPTRYDYSAFVKASYRFADYWNAFADLQYRRVEYKTDGINDKFIAWQMAATRTRS